jgi:hypothetical protein
MGDQLGSDLEKAVETNTHHGLRFPNKVDASISSIAQDEGQNFLRDLNKIFGELQASRPHESLSVLWHEVDDAIHRHIPEQLEEVRRLLLHGSLAYGAMKACQEVTGTYRYRRLGLDEIRLIVLYPSEDVSSKIECEICHERLRPELPYEALSYVWGDPLVTRPIVLGGRDSFVTDNLEHALRALRKRTEPRILWVDALCINQQDNVEKSSQIQLMASIYSLAHQVVVWLGKETNSSAEAFEILKTIIAPYRDDPKDRQPLYWRCEGYDDCPGPHDPYIPAGRKHWWDSWEHFFWAWENQGTLEVLQKFFRRAWWKRIWVFQEVVVATSAVMVCGKTTMSWNDFQQAASMSSLMSLKAMREVYLTRGNPYLDTVARARVDFFIDLQKLARPVGMMQFYREKRRNNQIIRLEALLQSTSEYKSTDPRDKVYALVGLVNNDPTIHEKLAPNYDVRTDVLYQMVAEYVIKDRGRFVVLEDEFDNNGGWTKNGVLCLSSWVPDYTDSHESMPISRDTLLPVHYDVHAATVNILQSSVTKSYPRVFDTTCHIAELHPPLPIAFASNLATMAIFGYTIDVVSTTLQTCLRSMTFEQSVQCLDQWHSSFHSRMALNNETFADFVNSSSNDVFWLTVFGGLPNQKANGIHEFRSALARFKPFPRTVEDNRRLRRELARLVKVRGVCCSNRKMFWTAKGLVGLGRQTLMEGDIVTVLCGMRVPVGLRKLQGRNNEWRIIGDWYVLTLLFFSTCAELWLQLRTKHDAERASDLDS